MGIQVNELLKINEIKGIRVFGEPVGLEREITGVTIIEAPDIVRFIHGGEALLTGLYAFQSCDMNEYDDYLENLANKEVSTIIIKLGRNVEQAEEKINRLLQFSVKHNVPILEIPFEISFCDVMTSIMERLFNEEVSQLKYFKTTHDNFSALVLKSEKDRRLKDKILQMLSKFIGNPVALYDERFSCISSTETEEDFYFETNEMEEIEPGIYSNYKYMKYTDEYNRYVVDIRLNFQQNLHLVVSEKTQPIGVMEFIAMESAIHALSFELVQERAIWELEKKFQNDIMHNLLYGKVSSVDELRKNINLLGVPLNGSYRVLVLSLTSNKAETEKFQEKISEISLLQEAIIVNMKHVHLYNNMDKIIVVEEVKDNQTQDEYRKYLDENIASIQKFLMKNNPTFQISVGIGKAVQGIIHIPESYKEAKEAFLFIDIAGEVAEDQGSQRVFFSDLGIYKLLCQLDDYEELLEYVPEGMKKLYQYKKPQREDLLLTLKTYLDRNQNLSKTAKELFVHYKTASYRIEKIKKITGIDFDNANEILSYRIGFIVYKMIEKNEKNLLY